MSELINLKVSQIRPETYDCVSLFFEVPDDLKSTFQHIAGQYLTLEFNINGQTERRAYSICTPAINGKIGVSVKKVSNGKVSTYINEELKEGTTVKVMPPEGNFLLQPEVNKQRDHYFFAAGSGITPIMSMITTVLEEEPKSTAYLLYGNRKEDTIIFKDQLDELSHKYEGQFHVQHILSQPDFTKKGGVMGMFAKKEYQWKGAIGRIEHSTIIKHLEDHPAKSKDLQFYICGPGDMIDTTRACLLGYGIPDEHIHIERFTASEEDKKEVKKAITSTLTAKINGIDVTVSVPKDKTILDALLDAGHEAPYSCTSGACSTCMAKIHEGKAEMEVCYALDDDEIKEGFILTCQAHPTTEKIVIDYD